MQAGAHARIPAHAARRRARADHGHRPLPEPRFRRRSRHRTSTPSPWSPWAAIWIPLRYPQVTWTHDVRPRRRHPAARRGFLRPPRRRRRDHRHRRCARRRRLAGCAPRSSTKAISRRARRRNRRSSCTAASAICSRRKSASSTRHWPSARSCARPRRISCACCPSSCRCSPRTVCSLAGSPRLLGTTMWAYDLTGGLRIGKLHKRVSKEEALALHADAARRQHRRVVRVLRRAGRRRAPHAHRRQDRGRVRRRGRQLRDAHRADEGCRGQSDRRARARRRQRDRSASPRGRERDRRVVRRGARPRRHRARDDDPAGQGHPHHRAVVVGAQRDRGRDSRCRRIGARCSSSRGAATAVRTASRTSARPTPTTTDRPTIRRSPPTTSPTSSARSTARRRRRSPRPTSSAPGPGSGRWSRRRRASAPPTSPGATRCTRRRAESSPSPAASSRPTGAWPPTRSTRSSSSSGRGGRSRTKRIPLQGADGWDSADIPKNLAERYGSDGRAVAALERADPELARPLIAELPYSRAEVVYAARAEMAYTVDDVLSRRTRARLLARDASAAVADDVAALMGAELGWTDEERATSGCELPGPDRRRAPCGRVARDRARRTVAPALVIP